MSRSLAIGEQSAVQRFSCCPLQEFAEAYQKSSQTADFSAVNKLWTPILQHLNPARYSIMDGSFEELLRQNEGDSPRLRGALAPHNNIDRLTRPCFAYQRATGSSISLQQRGGIALEQPVQNLSMEAVKKVQSKVWKERLKEMVQATKDEKLAAQIRGRTFYDKIQILAPRLDQMLKDFCKEYKTLHFIPRFFTERSFTPSFFEHLLSHYKDPKYAYLILYFIRGGKDCSSFFHLCEKQPKQFSEKGKRVFENEVFEQLFYFGIVSGITVDQFVKAGFKFKCVDPSGCSFVHYFLLKKEELMQVSARVSTEKMKEKKDYLASTANPVLMTEKIYLEILEALCAQSGQAINRRHDGKTALDIAIEHHYEKEQEILKKFNAEPAVLRVDQEEDDDFVVVEKI